MPKEERKMIFCNWMLEGIFWVQYKLSSNQQHLISAKNNFWLPFNLGCSEVLPMEMNGGQSVNAIITYLIC